MNQKSTATEQSPKGTESNTSLVHFTQFPPRTRTGRVIPSPQFFGGTSVIALCIYLGDKDDRVSATYKQAISGPHERESRTARQELFQIGQICT